MVGDCWHPFADIAISALTRSTGSGFVARRHSRDDDLVFPTQKSRNANKEKGLHRCNPLFIWRARQESNPRPPGS
jgi:hypothetical protein